MHLPEIFNDTNTTEYMKMTEIVGPTQRTSLIFHVWALPNLTDI